MSTIIIPTQLPPAVKDWNSNHVEQFFIVNQKEYSVEDSTIKKIKENDVGGRALFRTDRQQFQNFGISYGQAVNVIEVVDIIKRTKESAAGTPPPSFNTVNDTPLKFSTTPILNSCEIKSEMTSVMRNEIGHIYHDVSDFIPTFFYSLNSLKNLETFAATVEELLPADKGFPLSWEETEVVPWFHNIIDKMVKIALEQLRNEKDLISRLECRQIISQPNNSLKGSKAVRTLDIGIAEIHDPCNTRTVHGINNMPICHWREVLVPGELKSNLEKDKASGTWYDLAHRVREVFCLQSAQRFCHGFTLCGSTMRVFKFDRAAVYTSPSFDIRLHFHRFIVVMLGYLLMSKEELGLDTTICQDPDGQQYISVVLGEKVERFNIEDMIFRQQCIIGRGTTCWKAIYNNQTYVIKDSWQYEEKLVEGVLLTKVKEENIPNVAWCYHHEIVHVGQQEDDIFTNVRKGIDLSTGQKRQILVKKRKRDSGVDTNDNETLSNKKHQRLISPEFGKPLYEANQLVGVLQGLIGGISGIKGLRTINILHRDISIGNVLLSEDESKGFLIDLDHAIDTNRTVKSGAKDRTGTAAFMSIRVLDDDPDHSHSFMDDLESIFWLFLWLCIHHTGPGKMRFKTSLKDWNKVTARQLMANKVAIIRNKKSFRSALTEVTSYCAPLRDHIENLWKVVFPNCTEWLKEDDNLPQEMIRILDAAKVDLATKGVGVDSLGSKDT